MLRSWGMRARPAELPEWMDEPCSYEDWCRCLRDLDAANRWTLAARPTLAWLNSLPRQSAPLRILDVGFGSGGMLRAIAAWARKHGVAVTLTGVDLNPYAERVARQLRKPDESIRFLIGNVYSLDPGAQFDVIVSSLMTHHMEDPEIVRFLGWMEARAQRGWLVNDLYRARAPYVAFRTLAKAARWHRFVQHDGPVSIRRSFRKNDWKRLCAAAGVRNASIERWMPWRLCVGRVR